MTLTLDFGGFNTDDIASETLQALCFHISTTGYLEEESLRFIDVTDLELNVKPAVVDNIGQVVPDFEEEVVKKKNKHAAKRKKRLAKLCALVGSLLSSRPKSFLLLLSCSVPAPVSALVPAPMPTLVPVTISAPVLAPFSCLGYPIVLLYGCMPAPPAISCRGIPAFMSPLFMLGLPLLLGPLSLRTFQRSLSDKP